MKHINGSPGGELDAKTLDGLHASDFMAFSLISDPYATDMQSLQRAYDSVPDHSCKMIFYAHGTHTMYLVFRSSSDYGAVLSLNYVSCDVYMLRPTYGWRVATLCDFGGMSAVSADESLPGPEIMDDAGGVLSLKGCTSEGRCAA